MPPPVWHNAAPNGRGHVKSWTYRAKSHSDALIRRILMLARLPRAPKKISSSELKEALESEGYRVTLRTIERDLAQLSAAFPLECDDREKPYGWSWQRTAELLAIPGMSVRQAVVLLTAQKHLESQLPANLHQELLPLFQQAHATLGRSAPQASHWPQRVAQVANTQPLIAPDIAQDVLHSVHAALYHGHQLEITYQRRGAEDTRQHRLHPFLLVQRGPVFYLAGQILGKEDITLFAMHRIRSGHCLPTGARAMSESTRRDIMQKVAAGFALGEPIALRLHMRRELAQHVEEAPLSPDQESCPVDAEWTQITATVHDSAQLRWWLMGFGAGVKIKAPETLAEAIRQQHREAANV